MPCIFLFQTGPPASRGIIEKLEALRAEGPSQIKLGDLFFICMPPMAFGRSKLVAKYENNFWALRLQRETGIPSKKLS